MAYAFNYDKSKADLLEMVYPIGAIYMSVNDVNPGTLFGGTWEAWGSGRVPVGVNADDDNFATVEQTGGAATHTLTAAQMPSHTHSYAKPNSSTGSTTINASQSVAGSGGVTAVVTHILNPSHSHTIGTTSTASGSAGSGNAHNNLQPYITCYMWKRTA